jgi:hypothetical protein
MDMELSFRHGHLFHASSPKLRRHDEDVHDEKLISCPCPSAEERRRCQDSLYSLLYATLYEFSFIFYKIHYHDTK